MKIKQTENEIEAKKGYIEPLEIQIGINGMKLDSSIKGNKCDFRMIHLVGCYNCLSGSEITYECRSNFENAVAYVIYGKL